MALRIAVLPDCAGMCRILLMLLCAAMTCNIHFSQELHSLHVVNQMTGERAIKRSVHTLEIEPREEEDL